MSVFYSSHSRKATIALHFFELPLVQFTSVWFMRHGWVTVEAIDYVKLQKVSWNRREWLALGLGADLVASAASRTSGDVQNFGIARFPGARPHFNDPTHSLPWRKELWFRSRCCMMLASTSSHTTCATTESPRRSSPAALEKLTLWHCRGGASRRRDLGILDGPGFEKNSCSPSQNEYRGLRTLGLVWLLHAVAVLQSFTSTSKHMPSNQTRTVRPGTSRVKRATRSPVFLKREKNHKALNPKLTTIQQPLLLMLHDQSQVTRTNTMYKMV